MQKLPALTLLSTSVASAGDWVGSFMLTLGGAYKGTRYLDYSDSSRWELSACEKFGTYLVGRFNLQQADAVRTDTFVGPITEAQFWKVTNSLKGKTLDFGLGKGTVAFSGPAVKKPFPMQQIADSKNFKGTRFFVALANNSNKPVLCVATIYP